MAFLAALMPSKAPYILPNSLAPDSPKVILSGFLEIAPITDAPKYSIGVKPATSVLDKVLTRCVDGDDNKALIQNSCM